MSELTYEMPEKLICSYQLQQVGMRSVLPSSQIWPHSRKLLFKHIEFSTWIWRLQELWSDKNCPGNSKKKTLGDSLVWLVLLLLQPQSFLLPSRQLMGSHYLWYYSPTEETRHKASKVRNISKLCLRHNFVFYEMFVNSLSFLTELQIVWTQYWQGFLVSSNGTL